MKAAVVIIAVGATVYFCLQALLIVWNADGRCSGCRPDSEGSWSIGILRGPSPFELVPIEESPSRFNSRTSWPVANPVVTCASQPESSNFVADPFLFQHSDRRLYMFYETKSSLRHRGEIGASFSLDEGFTWTSLGGRLGRALAPVLSLHFPVQRSATCVRSTDTQLLVATDWLARGALVSTCDQSADNRNMRGHNWPFNRWIDPARESGAVKNGELEIYYADTPLGPWKAHGRNPVMNGDRRLGARSAGRPLVFNGSLYRFGQDCGETYGRGTVALPTKYRWNAVRQHHADVQQLSSGDWVAAIDADRLPSGAIVAKLASWRWQSLLASPPFSPLSKLQDHDLSGGPYRMLSTQGVSAGGFVAANVGGLWLLGLRTAAFSGELAGPGNLCGRWPGAVTSESLRPSKAVRGRRRSHLDVFDSQAHKDREGAVLRHPYGTCVLAPAPV
eukprot:jgi/Botrbrau1/2799/Bobra.0125s0011.2